MKKIVLLLLAFSSIANAAYFPVPFIAGKTTLPPTALTESAGATTIDWSKGFDFTLTLNANLTSVTFSNTTSGQTICVYVTNTASNYTVTWGNSILWTGGSQPVQTIGVHSDEWCFKKLGSTIIGNVVANY